MKVETKYSIGDTVWIVRFNYDRNEYVPDARKIVQIAIYIRENSLNIIYSLDTLYLQSFSENQLFNSREACQSACDQKNSRSML
jgi:hypothetical protein